MMFRSALSICILVLFPVCGFSQEKLEIVAAHYGDLPDGKKVDVTAKLLESVKENTLRVEASNDLFGDPVEQVAKKLRVRYRKGGTVEEATVAEGETLLIPVPKLVGELVIHKAVYGDLPQGPTYEVTEVVKGFVRNNQLDVAVENDLFGDPASGTFKRLRVEYSIGKVRLAKSVYEGGRMRITVPVEKPTEKPSEKPAEKKEPNSGVESTGK